MNVKKITLLMLSAVMAFSFTGCSKKDSGEEQKKFDEFMKQEFVESMEQSYPNTHIILENPKDYRVDTSKTKVQIPPLPQGHGALRPGGAGGGRAAHGREGEVLPL